MKFATIFTFLCLVVFFTSSIVAIDDSTEICAKALEALAGANAKKEYLGGGRRGEVHRVTPIDDAPYDAKYYFDPTHLAGDLRSLKLLRQVAQRQGDCGFNIPEVSQSSKDPHFLIFPPNRGKPVKDKYGNYLREETKQQFISNLKKLIGALRKEYRVEITDNGAVDYSESKRVELYDKATGEKVDVLVLDAQNVILGEDGSMTLVDPN
jgi:hypothetical protein